MAGKTSETGKRHAIDRRETGEREVSDASDAGDDRKTNERQTRRRRGTQGAGYAEKSPETVYITPKVREIRISRTS